MSKFIIGNEEKKINVYMKLDQYGDIIVFMDGAIIARIDQRGHFSIESDHCRKLDNCTFVFTINSIWEKENK